MFLKFHKSDGNIKQAIQVTKCNKHAFLMWLRNGTHDIKFV